MRGWSLALLLRSLLLWRGWLLLLLLLRRLLFLDLLLLLLYRRLLLRRLLTLLLSLRQLWLRRCLCAESIRSSSRWNKGASTITPVPLAIFWPPDSRVHHEIPQDSRRGRSQPDGVEVNGTVERPVAACGGLGFLRGLGLLVRLAAEES